MSKSAAIFIPARFDSSRFPGKPLAQIAGKSLIRRVWDIAKHVTSVSEVIIATDDARIQEAALAFGANVVMTSPKCKNGSERVYEAATKLATKPDIVVNFQGDAVLTPPSVLDAMVKAALNENADITTPAIKITWEQLEGFKSRDAGSASGTFVVCNNDRKALYFSRYPIPCIRKDSKIKKEGVSPIRKHIGIYAYQFEALKRYIALAPTPLEEFESLEQLRALEHGMQIKVVDVDIPGRTLWSIDAPSDVQVAESIIHKEGELV